MCIRDRSFDCGISGNLAAVIRAAMAGYPGCFLYWHNHAQTGFCQGECCKSQRRLILVEQRLEIKNFMYDENRTYWNGVNATNMRMMLKTCGYCDKDIKKKPHIGVANAYNSAAPGHAHLRQLAEQVKQGIWAAGGIPVEFGIPSTCGEYSNGNETLKYEQAGRDVVCMSIEFVTNVHQFDGLIILATCDLIISGAYLAAMRLDIPTTVVTGGSMRAGSYKDQSRLTASALDCAVTVSYTHLDVYKRQ